MGRANSTVVKLSWVCEYLAISLLVILSLIIVQWGNKTVMIILVRVYFQVFGNERCTL